MTADPTTSEIIAETKPYIRYVTRYPNQAAGS